MIRTVARIDRATREVLNVELAADEWLDAQADDPAVLFVAYEADQPAVIGLTHDPVAGFAQLPADDGTVTLTADTLAALALTAKQRAVIAAAEQAPTEGS